MKTAPAQARRDSVARAQAARREARNSLPRRDFAALRLKARQRSSERVLTKLPATTESGEPRIVDQPPIVGHPKVMDYGAMESLVERSKDFHIRQFRDMKGSFTLAEMNAWETSGYGSLCGGLLAQAHSQSTGSAFILGYLGGSETFDDALAGRARSYADRTEACHAALEQAVQSGRLAAERGV